MTWRILQGDVRTVLPTLPDESVHCVVTSPPYWGLRDYGVKGQIGQEDSPEEFVATMVAVFRDVRRVLRADGTLWLNLGDCYAGARGGVQGASGEMASRTVSAQRPRVKTRKGATLKPKDLVGVPWMVAFALRADGWFLRQDIVWSKPNPMPESVGDRCTKAHEYLFLLSKSASYYFDNAAIAEPCVGPGPGNPCVRAGCPAGGVVLDPFSGAGTTGMVAQRHGRGYIGVELNPELLNVEAAS